ncbi:MAG: cellulase family glycosylhydrolase [Solirubrobacteraceae bacterium]
MSSGTRVRAALVAIVAATVCCMAAPVAGAAAKLPLGHAGHWITDASGRVVVLHGANLVYKIAPFYPAAGPFGRSDAAFLRSLGFTAVRVGVLWEALEPRPGVYDDAYLNRIANTVDLLRRHGIVSLLDFHQDQYNEKFLGEGFPTWSVQDDGLPNPPIAFPSGYDTNPAVQRAFENFWADKPGPGGVGLQERYAAAWAHVAKRFRGNRSVLGYEIINEPFPGSDYLSCISPGCPASDAQLTSLEHKVDRAIRSVDARTLVFYEPYVTFNFGYPDGVGALGDPRAVFAWHDYCLASSPDGCSSNETTMQVAAARVAKTGEGTFMTEYGATTSAPSLQLMVSLADKSMVPWMYWSYCTCSDPTGSPDEGMVLDPGRPKTAANLRTSIVDSIVEPYPQVIAGTPVSWGFDRSTSALRFGYTPTRASGHGAFGSGAITEIAAPALVYAHGYSVRAAGAAIVSKPGAGVVRVVSCPHATSIRVTVAPGSRRSAGCRLRLHIAVSPHAARPAVSTAYRFRVTATLGSYAAPLAGARLSFAGHRVRTNKHGRAALRLVLAARRYTVTARAGGYRTGRVRLTVR